MWTSQVRVLDDTAPAAWLEARLSGEFDAVTRTVPEGYRAYARILHPPRDGDDELVTWAEVAATTGRTVHALAQWHAVVDSPDMVNFGESRWPYGSPSTGSLDEEALSPLCDVLAGHTTTADDCLFGLWEGWGWIYGGPAIATLGSREPVASPFTAQELAAPPPSPTQPGLLAAGRPCVGGPGPQLLRRELARLAVTEPAVARRPCVVPRLRDRLQLHSRGRGHRPHRRHLGLPRA